MTREDFKFPESHTEAELRIWGGAVSALREAYLEARNGLVIKVFHFAGILRYLVTGYCGYGGCGYATLYYYWEHCRRCDRRDMCQYSGEQVRPFVPEAGCPVHDADTRLSRWAQKARRGREWSPWQIQKRRLPDD